MERLSQQKQNSQQCERTLVALLLIVFLLGYPLVCGLGYLFIIYWGATVGEKLLFAFGLLLYPIMLVTHPRGGSGEVILVHIDPLKCIYHVVYLPPMSPPFWRPSLCIDSIAVGVKLGHINYTMQYFLSFSSIKWLILTILGLFQAYILLTSCF